MTDIFGPASATNSVTARPTETRSFGTQDTFFRDCTGNNDDGTPIQSSWLNQMLAVVRGIARGNGNAADATPVVPDDNSDDYLAWKSISHLVQRGQPKYSDDTGVSNSVVVTLSPAPKEYKKGMVIVAKVAAPNTGPAVINVNGLGAKNIVHVDGSALSANDLIAGALQAFGCDGTNFQLVWSSRTVSAGPVYLQAPRTFYVNSTTGNDSNDGAAATVGGGHGPFATLQQAMSAVAQFNLNGFNITVNVADGTYSGLDLQNVAGTGNVNWIGDVTTPANCLINGVNRSAVTGTNAGSAHTLNGFKFQASGSSGGGANGVNLQSSTHVLIQNCEWGSCASAHNSVAYGAQLIFDGALRISGGAGGSQIPGAFVVAVAGGNVNVANGGAPPSLTITAPVTFAGAFVWAANLSNLALFFSGQAGAGNVTGARFYGSGNSVISANGGSFPGSVSGSLYTGAQYS